MASAPTGERGLVTLRLPKLGPMALPTALFIGLGCLQFSLIFVKSFNWDEFLHYAMVHQLSAGTLSRPMQTLLARVLSWTPYVSGDLLNQMLAARVFLWVIYLAGLGAIYGVARHFASREDAIWGMLAYAAAGNPFAHGFAIRTDPLAMTLLMAALLLVLTQRLGAARMVAAGMLCGAASLLTVKSVFFAPCFAGIAWFCIAKSEDRLRETMSFGLLAGAALATFVVLYLLHSSGLAPAPLHHRAGAFVPNAWQWLTQGIFNQPIYTLEAITTAPLFVIALGMVPRCVRKARTDRDTCIALVALCLPLLSILVYRNVFPYFFVFILAPAAVVLSISIGSLRARIGRPAMAAAIMAVPVVMWAVEPHDVYERQSAVINYVHGEVTRGTTSLDYSGMIADYPRVIDHLVSGLGLANYRKRGVPLIAQAVAEGRLGVVIENHATISEALAGRYSADGLLAADVSALHSNFVRVGGNVWLAGEAVPEGSAPVAIEIPAAGTYVSDRPLRIAGRSYAPAEKISMAAGRYVVDGPRSFPTVMWRGERLPQRFDEPGPVGLFTRF